MGWTDLSFTIKGDTGYTGPSGDASNTGATGPTGPTGSGAVLNWREYWLDSVQYYPNDAVSFDAGFGYQIYVCVLTTSAGESPSSVPAKWGTIGTFGPTGPQGPSYTSYIQYFTKDNLVIYPPTLGIGTDYYYEGYPLPDKSFTFVPTIPFQAGPWVFDVDIRQEAGGDLMYKFTVRDTTTSTLLFETDPFSLTGRMQIPGTCPYHDASGHTITVSLEKVSGGSYYSIFYTNYAGVGYCMIRTTSYVPGIQGPTGETGYTGYTGPTGPASSGKICQAKLTSNQTITSNVNDTIIQFVDDIDPNDWWDATNYRFQPNISGYYLISSTIWWESGTGGNQTNIQLRKNGSQVGIVQVPVNTVSSSGNSVSITKLVQLNGSTEYVDMTAFTSNTAGTQTIQHGSGNGSWFSAALQ